MSRDEDDDSEVGQVFMSSALSTKYLRINISAVDSTLTRVVDGMYRCCQPTVNRQLELGCLIIRFLRVET